MVNPGGSVGESTRREIGYARQTGKPVCYLEPVPADDGRDNAVMQS